jgi:SAM-dependent methyltransferase
MNNAAPIQTRPSSLNLLFAATTLLSAWLLFQVQPMVAKRILPWFGGGAAIWTTTMLFFQAALFVGYLYAHLVAKALPSRSQVRLHCVLLALAAALVAIIGVVPPDSWQPGATGRPALRILATLAGCVGLPYLVLAATAPLVQVWFSRANPGRSPYRLYAISNFGSLAALLSYPLLLEPNLGVIHQGEAWSALFVLFAIACGASGLLTLRRAPAPIDDDSPITSSEPRGSSSRSGAPTTRLQYAFWIALPACASVLLLAITAYICQNIAPIPLLWIMPMVVYLVSFILTFDSDRWYDRRVWMPLAAITSFAAVYTWHTDRSPEIPWLVGLHLVLLLAVCMVCHGELARRRPPTDRLTTYYLCIAGGGALGGLFTGLVAPIVFVDHYELHLSLLAAWLLALGVLVTDRDSPFYDGGKGRAYAGLLVIAAMCAAFAIALGVQVKNRRDGAVEMARSFYGPLMLLEKVAAESETYLELANGHIAHGGQFNAPINRRVPMWYYHAQSGIGEVLTRLKPSAPRRIGVVGLGAGTMAAYGEKGDVLKFYDINAQVVDFAERRFSYLKDARERGAEVTTIEGDARRSLEQGEPQAFDVLVLDAFNGDAIPVHLLTLEAIDEYLRNLAPDGILAVHVTNSYLNLDAVVQAAVDRFKLDAAIIKTPADMTPGAGAATWILLHRTPGYFASHDFGAPLERDGEPVPPATWTDDYSNVVEILKW